MHLDLDFPPDVAAGAVATLERRDDVVTLASGHEERNQRWSRARRSYAVGLGIRTADQMAAVVGLFEAARGRVHSFRFRDWGDCRSCAPSGTPTATDQPLGTGDGAARAFQVVKIYGPTNILGRDVQLPRGLGVAIDGAPVSAWSLGPGGVVTFDTAPAPGAALTAGFFFDVPVRFDAMSLASEWAFFTDEPDADLAAAPDIQLVEVRL